MAVKVERATVPTPPATAVRVDSIAHLGVITARKTANSTNVELRVQRKGKHSDIRTEQFLGAFRKTDLKEFVEALIELSS